MVGDQANLGNFNRINSTFDSGPNLLVQTIEANFGIPINHVLQVSFGGFQGSVDALGGVYMDFPSRPRTRTRPQHHHPGCQLLNGTEHWRWPGAATTSTTRTATGSTTARATSDASSARTPS